ncbi:hypothetical protein Ddye_030851 [Dipteronia dyeriana]|uniref:Endonuclease/exonuclease/phosphatase domain-containing protein n=1 Tax=Dipteronia dyeriana TaxID=168575 RepID=A0AAD9WLU7_9ROSI|nr:hypothetical protein Ddye_030851 [Dipteronia dyeriana]
MGDFNEIQCDSEKIGGAKKPWHSVSEFWEAMEESGLHGMGFLGPKFTWNNYRWGDATIMERLDRGMCNRGWRDWFPNFFIRHLDFWGSDHRPLVLDFSNDLDSKNNGLPNSKRRFFFEECWMDDGECQDIVASN